MSITTRFAPSPTGYLHIGGARTALFSWLLAKNKGGHFLLRVEDTDRERSTQEATDAIIQAMAWLDLAAEGTAVFQSQRFDLYNSYIDQLLASGHAYWCKCTPDEVEAMREKARAEGKKPKYDGRCREQGLGPGAGCVVRFKTPQDGVTAFHDMVKGPTAVQNAEMDDMILRRSDGAPTYNLAVVVDDHDMAVTHVLRGDDHVANTPRQILLYQAFGWSVPEFGHVPMILGPDKAKLSKRHGALSVMEYKHMGYLPEALVNYLVRLGWSHGDQEIFSREELVQLFQHRQPGQLALGVRHQEVGVAERPLYQGIRARTPGRALAGLHRRAGRAEARPGVSCEHRALVAAPRQDAGGDGGHGPAVPGGRAGPGL